MGHLENIRVCAREIVIDEIINVQQTGGRVKKPCRFSCRETIIEFASVDRVCLKIYN